MNTFNDYKTAILTTRKIVKDAKELTKLVEPELKNDLLETIFNARQVQHDHIKGAKKEYPNFNWHSLI